MSAEVVESVDGLTLQGFVLDQVADGAKVYTDDHRGYHGLPNHQTVKHSVGRVRGRHGAYQRNRVLLVHVEAWLPRDLLYCLK